MMAVRNKDVVQEVQAKLHEVIFYCSAYEKSMKIDRQEVPGSQVNYAYIVLQEIWGIPLIKSSNSLIFHLSPKTVKVECRAAGKKPIIIYHNYRCYKKAFYFCK